MNRVAIGFNNKCDNGPCMSSSQNPNEVVDVLGNKYSPEILLATEEPTSAQEMSDEFGIPIATAYRRIEELTEAGLLEKKGRRLTEDDQRSNIYQRNVDGVVIEFENGEFTVSIEDRDQPKNPIDEVWRTLSTS